MSEAQTTTEDKAAEQPAPTRKLIIHAYVIEPPVNWPVHWFAHGDKNNAPHAGTPLQCNGRGQIRMFELDGRGVKNFKNTVPWIGDPVLKFRPDTATEQGAWDWIPGLIPPQYQNMQPEEPTILMLYKQHRQSIREIAEYMGPPWIVQRVTAVLQKHNALDSQQE